MSGRVRLGVVGTTIGLMLGQITSGCLFPCEGECPPPGKINLGTFNVLTINHWEAPSTRPFPLERATVTIDDEKVAVHYTRMASDVTVTYRVLRKH